MTELLYDASRAVDPLGDADAENEKSVKHNRAKVGSSRPSSLLYTYGPGAIMDLPQFTIMPTGLDDWNRIWRRAVAESGIPFKPTAYQVRHTHASWLIDAGENPKAVMHRLGQADLRTTARYVHVLDETGESAARRFEGLLPPL